MLTSAPFLCACQERETLGAARGWSVKQATCLSCAPCGKHFRRSGLCGAHPCCNLPRQSSAWICRWAESLMPTLLFVPAPDSCSEPCSQIFERWAASASPDASVVLHNLRSELVSQRQPCEQLLEADVAGERQGKVFKSRYGRMKKGSSRPWACSREIVCI